MLRVHERHVIERTKDFYACVIESGLFDRFTQGSGRCVAIPGLTTATGERYLAGVGTQRRGAGQQDDVERVCGQGLCQQGLCLPSVRGDGRWHPIRSGPKQHQHRGAPGLCDGWQRREGIEASESAGRIRSGKETLELCPRISEGSCAAHAPRLRPRHPRVAQVTAIRKVRGWPDRTAPQEGEPKVARPSLQLPMARRFDIFAGWAR